MIIYKITNTINGKIYIGKSEKNNEKYYGSGILIKKSIIKYGKENFSKEILEEFDNIERLNEREIYWINLLDSRNPKIGYNIAPGGEGFDIRELPNYQEIKEKMDKSPHLTKSFLEKYGEERSKEILSRRSKTFKENGKTKGDKNSSKKEEVRKKISEGNKKFLKNNLDSLERVKNQCKKMQENKKGKTFEDLYGVEKSIELKKKLREDKLGDKNPSKRKEIKDRLREKRNQSIQEMSNKPYWEFFNIDSEENFNIGFGGMKSFCEFHNINLQKVKYRLSKNDNFIYLNWRIKKI